MEPDFEARLRNHLHQRTRRIPDNATIIPALRHQLASTTNQGRVMMNHNVVSKIGIGVAAVLLVMAFAVVYTFGPLQHNVGGSQSTSATATVILTPTATSVPVQLTVAGITIEFYGIDANPVRTAIRYHILTQPTKAHEDYSPGDLLLSDSQHHSYQLIAGSGMSYSSNPQLSFDELDFVPFAPSQTGPVTMTFQILNILDIFPSTVIASGDTRNTISGPWTFTTTIIPDRSGMQSFTSAGVTSNSITFKAVAADWISGGDQFSHTGLHVQLAVSGLPTNLAGSTFFAPTKYVNANGGNGSQIDAPPVVTLTTPSHQVLTIPAIFRDTLNDDNTIGTGSQALLDIVFQNVVVTHGEDIQLLITNLSTCSAGDCSAGGNPLPGTWSLTLHL